MVFLLLEVWSDSGGRISKVNPTFERLVFPESTCPRTPMLKFNTVSISEHSHQCKAPLKCRDTRM